MRSAVVITGASRGFGRCLALDFTREITAGDVDMFLLARHEGDLGETVRLVTEAWASKANAAESKLQTFVKTVDLGDQVDYVTKFDAILEQLQATAYDRVYLVHNAGSIGDLCFTQELPSPAELAQYWEFNVNSVVWFNKRFLDVYGATREELLSDAPLSASYQAFIVNISSGCAIKPFKTYGMYCTGKAAREMHHRVIATEQQPKQGTPKIRVVSYSPGPMDTDMQTLVRESSGVHPEMAAQFRKMKDDGTLIAPEVSSRLGVQHILMNEFESGAYVYYYDIAPGATK
ncbi:hypothetical protein Poli38472_012659 [Pythium oligandrum]|uniref:Sepiapterin reductase n=1 Tax=Pythium oligandrum TaxID=41045 RepID=A0A8K1FK79_PYTOL|nr:hypothetical protein Poli38472_012659 [Pythium oligandrum]|eukprot:TMW61468.1 hypothetical protein Poli38472_012659 [Pythium oligandrum]